MKPRILVLGAGFGGLELSTLLSESLGDTVEVTVIDKSDYFIFGFSKLDLLFGHADARAVRLPYKNFTKLGVRMLQQTIASIDPVKRGVTTDRGQFEADYLVVALGAAYDFAATPGLADATEFYTEAGAANLRNVLPNFTRGRALIGVCGVPYKCPPAPSECALMLHDYLEKLGVRRDCEIDVVLPQPAPVPPSPETSRALVEAFTERGIKFHPNKRVTSIDATRKVATLDDGVEMGFDVFFGVPKHRAPSVVIESGLTEDGWVTVNPRTRGHPKGVVPPFRTAAIRHASSRFRSLSRRGRCFRNCAIVAIAIGIRGVAVVRMQLPLELNHVEWRNLSLHLVIATYDLAHFGFGRWPPADFHHFAATNVAHHAFLLDAQHEVGGDIVLFVLHHRRVGDGIDFPGWLPVAGDLAYRYQLPPPCLFAPRQEHGPDHSDISGQYQRRTANDQEGPGIDQVNHRCA
jgi:sulfide:quinone oxidoreductase